MLHHEVGGDGAGPRVVLVHGFTQTLRSWDAVAEALAARHQVVRVDLPGHGGSAGVRLGFEEAAAAVGDAGGRAAYVGYSLGGRLALRLALDRPDLVTALVLLGASPGLADPAARTARREADEALAASVERDGTDAFLGRWLAQPLFARLRPSAADLAGRSANRPEDLAAALRLLGTGTQAPLWDRLADLAMPVLLLAGAEDAAFSDVARRMAAAARPGPVGGGRPLPADAGLRESEVAVAAVPGAGHAAHLERPDRFVAQLEAFLDRHRQP
ncbi:MAG: alpha/beta fold hydrolase [Acidimicrobiales bacterium]